MQDNTPPNATPASVLLDPAAFCIPPHARISGQTRKYTADLKIGKPGPADWVRIHPDASFQWQSHWNASPCLPEVLGVCRGELGDGGLRAKAVDRRGLASERRSHAKTELVG